MMNPLNTVMFNGTNLADYGVYVSGDQTFSSAERDYEEIEIPGRSGSLFIDNKRFKNTEHSYDAWIGEDLENNLTALRAFLLSSTGYCRLEDTYHPDEFCKAIFKGPLDVETILLEAGVFTLTFTRMPQRFLKSGEIEVELTATDTIKNPTLYASKPLVRVYGYGDIVVNGYSITIAQNDLPYIDIDSEVVDCYCYQSNANSYVTMNSVNYPVLSPGSNLITISSPTITKLVITPRWWTV